MKHSEHKHVHSEMNQRPQISNQTDHLGGPPIHRDPRPGDRLQIFCERDHLGGLRIPRAPHPDDPETYAEAAKIEIARVNRIRELYEQCRDEHPAPVRQFGEPLTPDMAEAMFPFLNTGAVAQVEK
jgi:hypothetical protein